MQAFTPEEERAERAARVQSMLQRWAQEPEGTDPDWRIENIDPLALRREAETEDGTPHP
jgi:hypothetical protein